MYRWFFFSSLVGHSVDQSGGESDRSVGRSMGRSVRWRSKVVGPLTIWLIVTSVSRLDDRSVGRSAGRAFDGSVGRQKPVERLVGWLVDRSAIRWIDRSAIR